MSKIEDIEKKFKEESSLKATIEAQMRTLISLNKKLAGLQSENEHLKSLVTSTSPILINPDLNGMDEELIARSELRKLRITSDSRPLDMEETRKVEIYSKILSNLQNKPKSIEIIAKKLPTEQLLSIIESESSEQNG